MKTTFEKQRGIIDRLFNSRSIPVELFDEQFNSIYARPHTEQNIIKPKILQMHRERVDRDGIIILNEIVDYFYSIMKVENGYVVIGPSSSGTLEFISLQNLYKNVITSTEIVGLYEMIEFAPNSNIIQFGNMISLIYELLTGKSVAVKDIIDLEFFVNNQKEQLTTSGFDNSILDRKRSENIIYMERTVRDIVAGGKTVYVKDVQSKMRVLWGNSMDPRTIGMEQYMFIPFITVVSRAAIYGGVSIVESFKITNNYMKKYNEISGAREMIELMAEAVEEFCFMVASTNGNDRKPEICDLCEKYIYEHLYEKILIEDMAQYCNKSVRQLQRIFNEYYDCSFSEYILNAKLEKAELLLYGTNSSISDICRRMGFESQSYFTKKFTEKYGSTPGRYRKNRVFE